MEHDIHNERDFAAEIAESIERQSKINFEIFTQQIRIAEVLREHLTASLEMPILKQLEIRMYIGEHCGMMGIRTCSITCDRSEFERRKDSGEL